MYEWVKNEARNPNATLYLTNITLNRSAIEYLENPWHVMLGVDKVRKQIAIRPVSPQEVSDGFVSNDEIYRISIGRSYGRIANRSFCTMINDLFSLDLTQDTGRKYPLSFNARDQLLIIDLAGGEIE